MNYIDILLVLVLGLDTDLPHRLLTLGCPPASKIFYSYVLSSSTGIYSLSFLISISISIYRSHSFSSSFSTTRHCYTTSESLRRYNIYYTACAATATTSIAFRFSLSYYKICCTDCELLGRSRFKSGVARHLDRGAFGALSPVL